MPENLSTERPEETLEKNSESDLKEKILRRSVGMPEEESSKIPEFSIFNEPVEISEGKGDLKPSAIDERYASRSFEMLNENYYGYEDHRKQEFQGVKAKVKSLCATQSNFCVD